jgi:hypothetical protein
MVFSLLKIFLKSEKSQGEISFLGMLVDFHLFPNGRSQSVRKVIQPDSPVSPEDIDFAGMTLEISSDTEKLKAELESARQEIADLVHAVHQKDQSVIDAHKKIEE